MKSIIKNRIYFSILFFCIFPLVLFSQKNYSKLVNPFIGTGGHGHTYPGATSPFGMVQLSPDTRMADWDGSSGYHYSDSIIYGFSHTHLSGTGIPDYCDILIQPTTGNYEWDNKKYASAFKHSSEKAYAGYYEVHLDKYDVDVALTTSMRTGIHRYQFSKNTKEGNILIDLIHRDEVLDSHIEILSDGSIRGYRFSKSWAQNQKIFFAARFNKKIIRNAFHENDSTFYERKYASGKKVQAYVSFDVSDAKPLEVQVAVSAVSMDNAMQNLIGGDGEDNFDKTLAKNIRIWNEELGKIDIQSQSYKNIDTIFYTALYHTMVVPNFFQDVNGDYRGTDDKIHQATSYNNNTATRNNYSVFSLWDTYRAYHPLMSLINRARTNDWIHSFLNQYKYGGMLPVWELAGNETYCMIGYHSIPVMVDAYKKGIRDFDTKLALEAMLSYSRSNKFGIDRYAKQGFLSNDIEGESVSKTLEYAYDDWCIAEFAKLIGEKNIATEYYLRSENYKNLYNPSTKFFLGKIHGAWVKPFDPSEINNFYTEGNAWHYRFAVPQDVEGLKKLMGGEKIFYTSLQNMFTISAKMNGREQADVTGLIGQYAHGNEPSHHIAYLFANANLKKNETPFYVNKICNEFYKNTPYGLIGNEDCGQMSAWYIWSALGMYPVNPASNEFTIGSPQVKSATIHLENGKNIVIHAERKNENAYYPIYASNKINFDTIKNGTTINFTMVENKDLPQNKYPTIKTFSRKNVSHFVTVPFIANGDYKFKAETIISLKTIDSNNIKYFIGNDNGIEKKEFIDYKKPFRIQENTKLFFYAEKGKYSSAVVEQPFYKISDNRAIEILTKINPMYTAGGKDALIDGVIGTTNWQAGEWQSYYGNNLEAVIDLKNNKAIKKVTAVFLQDIRSWIWMPLQMEVYSSNDNINFKLEKIVPTSINEKDEKVQIEKMVITLENCSARYIKIVAINHGIIGNWHVGVGNISHLFVSEIMID